MTNQIVKKLNNGFVVAFVPHRGVKSVTLQLRGYAGSNFENTRERGAAHLVEHMSLECPGKDELLLKGAKIIGVTSRDEVMFMVKVLKKDFYHAVDYLGEVFTFEGFSESMLRSQKGVSEEEEKRFMNVPEKLIGRLSYRLLYPNQRMAEFNTGSIEDINKISREEVFGFKKRLYRPENFSLTVSGDLRSHQVVSRSLTVFGRIGPGLKKQNRIKPVKLKKNKKFKIQNIVNRFYTQTHVMINYYGYLLSDTERFSALVLAKILDNYLKSEIKTKRGYAYNVGCESFSSHSYGIFTYYFASDKKNIENILRTVLSIKVIFSDVASPDSILVAKNQLLSEMEFAYEKTSFRAEYYSNLVLQGLYKQTFSYELNKIENVSYEDLHEVYKRIIGQEPKITVLSDTRIDGKIKEIFKGK